MTPLRALLLAALLLTPAALAACAPSPPTSVPARFGVIFTGVLSGPVYRTTSDADQPVKIADLHGPMGICM